MSEIYIEYRKNGFVCGPSSAKKKHILQLNSFSHHNVSGILSRRSGYYFVDILSKETWMVVFKVFLTIFPRPAVQGR